MVDFQYNYPILPGQDAIFSETLQEVARDGEVLKLAPYGGLPEHRAVGARWLSTKEHTIPQERALVAAGGHNAVIAIMLAAGLIGKKIACDPLTYSGFIVQARTLGCPLVPCVGDEDGMLPDALEKAARDEKVAAVFLMPTLHNPLGTVMSFERRLAIVEVARRYGLLVIDDDAYRFLVADAPPNFAALAPELGFSVYSFTKPFAPALKVAYFAFPETFCERLTQALRITSSGAPRILSEVLARLIGNGNLMKIISAKRKEGAERQRFAQELLRGLPIRGYETSYHVWLDLPEEIPSADLTQQLAAQGIAVSPSGAAIATPEVRANGIRVAMGAERDSNVVRAGLETVRRQIEASGRVPAR